MGDTEKLTVLTVMPNEEAAEPSALHNEAAFRIAMEILAHPGDDIDKVILLESIVTGVIGRLTQDIVWAEAMIEQMANGALARIQETSR